MLPSITDTAPAADQVRLELFRAMTPARRLALAAGWSDALRQLLRAQIRQERPDAPEAELRRAFASRWLGEELAAKAYGPV